VLAARVNRFGEPPVTEDVPAPAPAEGESLIRIEAAVVGHLDLGIAGGRFPLLPSPPYTPGTGGAGRVLESDEFEPGILVEVRGGGLGLVRDGTWAELAAVPNDALHRHPETSDPVVAATFYGSFMTAHVALFEVGELRAGERVAVTGAAGAVGSLAVGLALRAGAEVVGIVSRDDRRSAVPAGADVVVGSGAALGALEPVDLLVDTIGGDSLLHLVERVRPGGRASLVGYTTGEVVPVDLPRLLFFDVRLLPVNVMTWEARAGDALARAAAEEAARGTYAPVVRTFPLERAQEAVQTLEGGRADGRVVLVPDR
jgi:NADPH:quinone reductase-like Zn-dependent oxidoreductase